MSALALVVGFAPLGLMFVAIAAAGRRYGRRSRERKPGKGTKYE